MTYEEFLSARIRTARVDAGFTSQEKLAREMGLTSGAVGLWERAKTLPSVVHLWCLVQITKKPLEFFFPDAEIAKKLTEVLFRAHLSPAA